MLEEKNENIVIGGISMFDDYEDYNLSHSDDNGSGNYSGDGCLTVILLAIGFIILQSLF